MEFFQFRVPTKVVFGAGLSRDFSAELEAIPAKKYFLVTDKLLSELGIVKPVIDGLEKAGHPVVGVFKEVPSDSGVYVVEACAEAAKLSGAEAIIAIGGGSVLDTAKGANILFSLGGDLVQDYSGAQTITEELCPLIAIPTTAGTGSEVTEAIVIQDESTASKISFVDFHLLPTLALLDPELTVGLPPVVTAATAMDALTHAIEAVMSVQKGPIPEALACQAIQLIFKNVLTAVRQGNDREARSCLLIAATMAGMAFNHAMVGVVHAVAHTLGGMFHLHHGTANGIFLPYGMEYNLEVRQNEIASLAPFLGIKEPIKDIHEKALASIAMVKKLLADLKSACGLPTTLKEGGVKKEDLAAIAAKAPEDGASFYNPRPVNSEDLLPFLEKAF